ncbi:alpha/beta hydrolase [Flexivirga endophytica]|uniref:Alpha/beta hydrolase n=1 Tax=Flexivirga endophytica TaxID=1849103 RepID=A0A916WX19_9MICO|nr:alpha/beta fold hydrolase [Flexivirga endophytica]GGB36459.1 alpha/beta hydrolase [Flexivirga endophytica]GHB44147.1 alpha/beta hydrolase [Flexivirga endophytica]
MDEPTKHQFASFDGTQLVWRELGDGRPVVLIHGFVSNAVTNWIRYGHAKVVADKGFRVIMPDLRGHGDSGQPHDAAAYPPDVLAMDGAALVEHLGLTDYDLGGYSLGAHTCVRMVLRGARPSRLVTAGMGLDGIENLKTRDEVYETAFDLDQEVDKRSAAGKARIFMRQTGSDPVALRGVWRSSVRTDPTELAGISQPLLAVSGAQDTDHRQGAEALAAAVQHGTFVEIPGNHMSAVADPALGRTIADWLAS